MKYKILKILLLSIFLLATPFSVPFAEQMGQKSSLGIACAQSTSQIISETYHTEMKSPSRLRPLNQSDALLVPETSLLPNTVRQKKVEIVSQESHSPLNTKYEAKNPHGSTHDTNQMGKTGNKTEINNIKQNHESLQSKEKNTYASLEENSKESIHLIDTLDVYALSSYANYLRLPSSAPSFTVSPSLSAPSMSDFMKIQALQSIINEAALKFGLNPALITAVIKVESNFLSHALSPKGAQGLMQIMPQTQAYLGVLNPYDAKMSIMAGSAYLREQLDRFGTEELALAAYNAGPYNVIKHKGIPPFLETRNYVNKVLAYKNKITF